MQATLETLYPAHDRPRLIDAVKLRTSCRSYLGAPDAAEYAALSYALGRYSLPGARLAFFPVDEGFFTGTLLGMKKITGCRLAAAVIITDTPLSRIHAGIPRCSQAAVSLMDDADSSVPLRPFIAEHGAAVRRTIVHQNDLQITVGLLHHGADAFLQIFFYPIDRNDNGNQFSLHNILLH